MAISMNRARDRARLSVHTRIDNAQAALRKGLTEEFTATGRRLLRDAKLFPDMEEGENFKAQGAAFLEAAAYIEENDDIDIDWSE